MGIKIDGTATARTKRIVDDVAQELKLDCCTVDVIADPAPGYIWIIAVWDCKRRLHKVANVTVEETPMDNEVSLTAKTKEALATYVLRH